MDLAVLHVCYMEPKIAPIGCFQLAQTFNLPLHGFPPPPTLHPNRSACGIGVASKTLAI